MSAARLARLADFQNGRAPGLAVLTAERAAKARSSMLARRRRAAAARYAAIETEAAQAHLEALIAETVAVLAEALGYPNRLPRRRPLSTSEGAHPRRAA